MRAVCVNTCLCMCDWRGESLTALRTGSSSSHIVLLNGLNMLLPQDATTGSGFEAQEMHTQHYLQSQHLYNSTVRSKKNMHKVLIIGQYYIMKD